MRPHTLSEPQLERIRTSLETKGIISRVDGELVWSLYSPGEAKKYTTEMARFTHLPGLFQQIIDSARQSDIVIKDDPELTLKIEGAVNLSSHRNNRSRPDGYLLFGTPPSCTSPRKQPDLKFYLESQEEPSSSPSSGDATYLGTDQKPSWFDIFLPVEFELEANPTGAHDAS